MSSPADVASSPAAPTVTTEGETFDSPRLRYVDTPTPASGKSIEVTTGVRWARIPLPLDLNHINVWLLEGEEGYTAVDTGMAASMGKDAWELLAQDVFATRPLRAVFVTHIHPDHIGLAAWLQERFDAPVLMSTRTFELARDLLSGGGASFSGAEDFFRACGLTDASHILPLLKPERFARMASGLPRVEQYVANEALVPGAEAWRALETNGHAEGHLCLWNEAARVLISGDQVLPTISSNISLTFRGGDENPLRSYLESLQRLRELPADTLVLPSHGAPFYGLHQRIDDLIRHHHEQLAVAQRACLQPRSAVELLSLLFRRELKGMHLFFALGEALAHLEYLAHAGRLTRQKHEGVVRYENTR